MKQLDETGEDKGRYTFEASHVVEQRVSNLAQGLLTLGTMSGPLLVVLHLIPHGVLAGLFFIMGVQALEANGITTKLMFLARDKSLTPATVALNGIKRRSAIWMFVAIELIGFGATFAITQTIAAVGFPVFIVALIPIRALLLPMIFTLEELEALDAPTASEFIMEGIGGSWGGKTEKSLAPGGRNSLVASRSHSSSRRGVHPPRQPSDHQDSVFASPGCPRKSQEDLAELGQIQSAESTATRRRSVDRRSSHVRKGSSH